MTAFRRTTPDVEAAQYVPTDAQPLTFTDEPEWLVTALEIGRITVRASSDLESHYLVLQAKTGVELVAPNDWIVRDRWGAIYSLPAASFGTDFELFPEAPVATEAAKA